MVKHILLLLIFLPSLVLAGDFTATVSRNQVPLGESFTLNLTLKDASAKGNPDTDALSEEFIIHSQQQSSNTVFINGKMSSSKSWRLTLIPHKEGELRIPRIHIETTEGTLSSNPIIIHVGNNSAANGENSQSKELTLTTFVSNPFPYKNEPFTYTIKLVAEKEVANVKIRDFSIEGAIVEAVEKPVVEEKITGGIHVRIITFRYLITPMQPGTLTLPPIVIQGGIPERRRPKIGSFFDMDLDSFGMMGGFQELKPFALSTEETAIG